MRSIVPCDSVISFADAADQVEVTLAWMSVEPMVPGRTYLLNLGPQTIEVTFEEPKYRLDRKMTDHLRAKPLEQNEIGVCNMTTDQELSIDPAAANQAPGGFILVDKISKEKIAAVKLNMALQGSHNIRLQPVEIDKAARAARNEQRPIVLWFTGLSGAGKSTIANLVEKQLHDMGRHTYLLDGDNVRHGLCKDLGFADADRVENIRRVAEVSKLMVDAGLMVLTAFISPFRADRALARAQVEQGEFIEIYVEASLEVVERRDVKGLYRKARSGGLPNFTGIDSPYEAPDEPEIRIDTSACSPEEAAAAVIWHLSQLDVLG